MIEERDRYGKLCVRFQINERTLKVVPLGNRHSYSYIHAYVKTQRHYYFPENLPYVRAVYPRGVVEFLRQSAHELHYKKYLHSAPAEKRADKLRSEFIVQAEISEQEILRNLQYGRRNHARCENQCEYLVPSFKPRSCEGIRHKATRKRHKHGVDDNDDERIEKVFEILAELQIIFKRWLCGKKFYHACVYVRNRHKTFGHHKQIRK